jgi:D-beta-D-heptose 7-phosphate kinase/D-beta-D-heptose 1-phosphate adenosyltransferase
VKSPAHRVLTAGEAVALASSARERGLTVVFTNGVFDLLHPGHVRYLQEARRLGDLLIVAVNSDRSVRSNKGAGRPINPASERAELVAALACVDAVVLFDEDTPQAIVSQVQPDVLVKGEDWPATEIVGREAVEGRGGRVVRIALAEGHSTTGLIARVRTRHPRKPAE